jgi:hypothetical protein
MSRSNPTLILAYTAAAAIAARTIVKFGANDGVAAQATAVTDASIGVSTDISAAQGETVDVQRSGVVPVVYGAEVTRGMPLTAGAGGKAIPAVNVGSEGDVIRIIGIAEVSGAANDVGSVLISPSLYIVPAGEEI